MPPAASLPPGPLRLTAPALAGRSDEEAVRSALLRLVACGAATSRAELARTTGLARSTVTTHVQALLAGGALRPAPQPAGARGGRGRPTERLELVGDAGTVLVLDVGTARSGLAVADLGQRRLATAEVALPVEAGPREHLDALAGHARALLREAGGGPLRAVVAGLPSPVDVSRGVPVRPPIMPGWDGHPVAADLAERLGVRPVVDNDANLRALGAARALPAEQSPLLHVEVGTGIGAGLVTAEGVLHRGADGAAGDIGHVRVPGADDVRCRCGSTGCVEAVASAAALAARLVGTGGAQGVAALVARLRACDPDAVRLAREAARTLGEVLATAVHLYNPRRIVLGGPLAEAGDDLLAGVREVVYSRALPLATRNLHLSTSPLGEGAGLAGGVVAAVEQALSPRGVRELLAGP
ncbi:putative NBD/HSP70 family sugar kinase [Kineococcus xinjiangensis]|uniref:Putative NBD/HSP70 family sugar kinase n=1 Tax=Kineococcus xinjiangensis TaxID=512762 RepID=A0A2S6ITV2_9ACTN|nr:ROK family protein [Kineococcus xinjiangensis]PPK97486.1 putative NBD/HSP70 family sugar kinase [Kineococcus xinjiangensis]